MTRIARVVLPHEPHHITQRGIRRLEVFRDNSDRQSYLHLIVENSRRFGLHVLAYCLMTNHIHLVAIPTERNSIWKTLHRSHSIYAMKFNSKYGLTGHLWQGRAYSCVLDEAHLWAAVRYVELNPVRAHLVSRAEDYRWSSAQAHCGLRDDSLLHREWPSAGAVPDWSEWLSEGESAEANQRIRERTFSGQPCGDSGFVQLVEYSLGRNFEKKKPGPKPK